MKATPPGAKDSWDSKYPDSSFSKNELSGKAGPEFALGNNSTFREIVKGWQLFQVKQTLPVSFYTQTQKHNKIDTAQKIIGKPIPFKSQDRADCNEENTHSVSTGYISTHHIQCHTTRYQAGAADKVEHVRARKKKAADDNNGRWGLRIRNLVCNHHPLLSLSAEP